MTRRLPTALLLALAAAGCGQTGPLYLPDQNAQGPVEIRPAPPATPPAAAPPPVAAPPAPPRPEDERARPPGATR